MHISKKYSTLGRNLQNVLTLVLCFWTLWSAPSLCEFIYILFLCYCCSPDTPSLLSLRGFQQRTVSYTYPLIVNSQGSKSMNRYFDDVIQKGGLLLLLSKLSLMIPAALQPLSLCLTCHLSLLFSIRPDSSLESVKCCLFPEAFLAIPVELWSLLNQHLPHSVLRSYFIVLWCSQWWIKIIVALLSFKLCVHIIFPAHCQQIANLKKASTNCFLFCLSIYPHTSWLLFP